MPSSAPEYPSVDCTYVAAVQCSDNTADLWIAAMDFIVPDLYRNAFMDGCATVIHSLAGTVPNAVIDMYGKQVDLMDFVVVREGQRVVAKAVHPEGRILRALRTETSST